MMRNHKIVSTVNAMSLLGFVAQRTFSLSFINLTLPSFCYSSSLNTFQTQNYCGLISPALDMHLMLMLIWHSRIRSHVSWTSQRLYASTGDITPIINQITITF